jgi:hypothetical protein
MVNDTGSLQGTPIKYHNFPIYGFSVRCQDCGKYEKKISIYENVHKKSTAGYIELLPVK